MHFLFCSKERNTLIASKQGTPKTCGLGAKWHPSFFLTHLLRSTIHWSTFSPDEDATSTHLTWQQGAVLTDLQSSWSCSFVSSFSLISSFHITSSFPLCGKPHILFSFTTFFSYSLTPIRHLLSAPSPVFSLIIYLLRWGPEAAYIILLFFVQYAPITEWGFKPGSLISFLWQSGDSNLVF